ncbi:MAG: hypothetical protein JSS72_05545 [Armatimonadetes bacterium]|nr:hypothetical protein [Armatimonadota bacterium]
MITLALYTTLAHAPMQATAPTGWTSSDRDVTIRSKRYHYTASAGYVNLPGEKAGEVAARMFFTAYTMPSDPNRPITFVWNGGPGGSSILMHMYNLGPRKLVQMDEKQTKYDIVDNDNSLLPTSDLVFMDPVGTGFSKADKADPKTYWGVEGDIQATRKFIQGYLDQTGRKSASVFLAGESYGTFRAAGVAYPLIQHDVNLKGIVLISNAVNLNTFAGDDYNDVVYLGYLPTYTAIAAHHHKLSDEWNKNPQKAIAESIRFDKEEYIPALEKGDALTAAERMALAKKLSSLTGIDAEIFDKSNLRLDPERFRNIIMKEAHKPVDRYNGAILGNFEPASKAAVARFTQYLKDEIGFTEKTEYVPLSFVANFNWKWGTAIVGPPNVSDRLKTAMVKSPALRVLVAQGCYDLATPFFGEERTMLHLGLPDNIKDHWKLNIYEGGHMMYLVPESHVKLHDDIEKFMTSLK